MIPNPQGLTALPEATFWRMVREEISPMLVDEAESLQSADKDDLPGVADAIMRLAVRLDNLVTGNIVAPMVALEALEPLEDSTWPDD